MHSNPHKRNSQRGNSFSTCLLTMIIVFGGIGFYYFTYFQWRHFEEPTKGLTYVKETSAPQKNDFRKKTVASVCDPIRHQIERVKDIRKKTKKGKEKYPELEQDLTEVRNRLKDIMTEGRLRRIPVEFKKKYVKSLFAMQSLMQSINKFEDSFDQETVGAREKLYKDSYKDLKKAEKQVMESRNYFNGEGWKEAR